MRVRKGQYHHSFGSSWSSGWDLEEGLNYVKQLKKVPQANLCLWKRTGSLYNWLPWVAQTVSSLPAMQETWVWSLCQEGPLEKEMVNHSNSLAWRIPMDRGVWQVSLWGHKESDWVTKNFTLQLIYCLCYCYLSGLITVYSFVPLGLLLLRPDEGQALWPGLDSKMASAKKLLVLC